MLVQFAVHKCYRKLTSRGAAEDRVHLHEMDNLSDESSVEDVGNDEYENVFASGYAEVGKTHVPESALQLNKNIAYATGLKSHS